MRKYSLFFLSWITIFRVSEKKINLKRLQLRKWPRQTPHGSRISLGRAEVHHRDAYCFPNPARSWAARKILRIPLGVSLGLGRSVFCRAARPSPRPPPPRAARKICRGPFPFQDCLGPRRKSTTDPPPKKLQPPLAVLKYSTGRDQNRATQNPARGAQAWAVEVCGPWAHGRPRSGPWEAQGWAAPLTQKKNPPYCG